MSSSTIHEIVSNADTIIYLKNPGVDFAQWEEPVPPVLELPEPEPPMSEPPAPEPRVPESPVPEWPISESAVATTKKLSRKDKLMMKKKKGKKSRYSSSVLEAPTAESMVPAAVEIPLVEDEYMNPPDSPREDGRDETFWDDAPVAAMPAESREVEESSSAVAGASQDFEETPATSIPYLEVPCIEFRVCAGNLMSASPWFNRLLKKNGWMESNRNTDVRWFQVHAEDWNEEAFTVLMNIFHLRNSLVPRAVSLEMLAKIAILADYYECDESIQLFVDMWIVDLKKTSPVPKAYCRDLLLWIWIAWAFRIPDLFQRATYVAIKQANEPVRNLGLPIPSWVTEELDSRRHRAIESLILGVNSLLNFYKDPTYSCPSGDIYSSRCGSMLLGALMRQLEPLCLLSTQLEAPYLGRSLDAICGTARKIDSETWNDGGGGYNYGYRHSCILSGAVAPLIDATITSVDGLSLG